MLKRRIIALLLLTTMIFTTFTVVNADEDAPAPSASTTTAKVSYAPAVTMMRTLGIIPSGSGETSLMSRGQFANFMLTVLNININLSGVDFSTYFTDVPSNHQYGASIMSMYTLEIMNGVGNKLFEPDRDVTIEEAIKVVVCALGYGIMSVEGTYLADALTKATELRLLRNVSGNYSSPASLGVIAQLLYNASEVRMLRPQKIGVIMEYSSQEGKTLLDINNVAKGRGIITETYITSLDGISSLKDGEVIIDGRRFLAGRTTAPSYLGYTVEFYTTLNKDYPDEITTLLFVEPALNRNEIVNINEEDFSGYISNADLSHTFNYVDGRRVTNVKASRNAKIIYNGMANPGYDLRELNKYNAIDTTISLIDNTNDGEYDIIIINKYISFVVESASAETGSIRGNVGDRHADPIRLDPNDTKLKYRIYNNGALVDISYVRTGNVVSYTEASQTNINGVYRYYEIIVCDDVVDSYIDVIYQDGGYTWLDLEGDIYRVKKDLVDDEYVDYRKFRIDDEAGTFRLTFDGKIISFAPYSAGDGLAYVITMKLGEGIDDTVTLKLIDVTGVIKMVKTAEMIYLDKSEVTGGEKIPASDLLNNVVVESSVRQQLIKYKTNFDGDITEILTRYNPDQNREHGLQYTTITGTVRYDQNVPTFHLTNNSINTIMLDSETIVFRVPRSTERLEDYRFSVGRSSLFRHGYDYGSGTGGEGTIEVYNISDKMNKAGIVVLRYGGAGNTGSSSNDTMTSRNMRYAARMIDTVMSTIDEDGEIFQVIKFADGSENKFSNDSLTDYATGNYPSGGIVPSDLNKADVVLCQIDSDNLVYNLAPMRTFEEVKDQPQWTNGTGDWAGSATYTSGRVVGIEGNVVMVMTAQTNEDGSLVAGGLADRIQHLNMRGLPVIIYDTELKKNEFKVGSVGDISIGDIFMMRTTDGWAGNEMYCYKGI